MTEEHGCVKGLDRLMSLWNYSLSAGVSNALGPGADGIFLKVGGEALERLSDSEGVDLIRATPVDTINAVYAYFTRHGYFKDAHAEAGRATKDYTDVVEITERWNIDFHASCWAVHNRQVGSHACFCYNVVRAALHRAFGLDIRFLDSTFRSELSEMLIKAALVPASRESAGPADAAAGTTGGPGKGCEDRARVFETAVQMSLDAMVTVDEDSSISLWNRAAEQMFGYAEGEVKGRSVEMLMPEKYRARHREGFKRFLTTGESRVLWGTVEAEGVRKNGEVFPIELSLAAERVDGRWVFTGVIRDISHRKELEDELDEKFREMGMFNRIMVGRELKMEELREEIRELRAELEGRRKAG